MNRKWIMLLFLGLAAVVSCGEGTSSGSSNDNSSSHKEWTIMYYGDADNNLEEDIMMDLNELEAVDISSKAHIVALADRSPDNWTGDGNWTDSRAFYISKDSGGYNATITSSRIAIPDLGITVSGTKECDMASEDTLSAFISHCKNNYSSDKYMLIMSDHGGGWRDSKTNPVTKARLKQRAVTKDICWDDTTGSNAFLKNSDVAHAISTGMGGEKLDILAFDACLMAGVETAYQMKDAASYLVASEETVPGYGFPYTAILTNAAASSDLSAVNFGTIIVNDFTSSYTNGTTVEGGYWYTDTSATMALIDLSKIQAVADAVNSYAASILNTTSLDFRFAADTYTDSNLVDISDYCTRKGDGTELKAAISAAVLVNSTGSDHAAAKGLSIYFPNNKTLYSTDYSSSAFALSASAWKTLISTYTPTLCTDDLELTGTTYIGNDGFDSAYGNYTSSPSTMLTFGTATYSYIMSKSDFDYFVINDSNGSFTVTLSNVTAGKSYAAVVYGYDGTDVIELKYDISSSGTASIYMPSTATYEFYFVMICSDDGTYSPLNPYSIKYE